jgi:hypothetical protein
MLLHSDIRFLRGVALCCSVCSSWRFGVSTTFSLYLDHNSVTMQPVHSTDIATHPNDLKNLQMPKHLGFRIAVRHATRKGTVIVSSDIVELLRWNLVRAFICFLIPLLIAWWVRVLDTRRCLRQSAWRTKVHKANILFCTARLKSLDKQDADNFLHLSLLFSFKLQMSPKINRKERRNTGSGIASRLF